MNENFLSMLGSLKKDDMKYLLSIYDYVPDEDNSEEHGSLGENLIGTAKKLVSGLDYYDPGMSKEGLHKLLLKTIVKANNIKKIDNLDNVAKKIVSRIAELEDAPVEPELSTRDIENRLFLSEAEEMLPIYLLAQKSMLLMSKQETAGIKGIQEKIIKAFTDEVLVTRGQRRLLNKELKSTVSIKELRELTDVIKKNKNVNTRQICSSILGFTWIIAVSNDVISRKEISFYKELYTIFGFKQSEANKIKHRVEDQFEEIRDVTVSALGKKGTKVGRKNVSDTAAGIAGSLAVLGLAEAAGFGLFLFSTGLFHSMGKLFGITFSHAAYTELNRTLGLLRRPAGWTGIPLVSASGQILKNYFYNKDYEKTKRACLKLSFLRADK